MLFLNFIIFNSKGELLNNKKIFFYVIITVLVAFFSYKYIEKPALNYFKNKRG